MDLIAIHDHRIVLLRNIRAEDRNILEARERRQGLYAELEDIDARLTADAEANMGPSSWLNRFLDGVALRREVRHRRKLRRMRVVLPPPQPDERDSLRMFHEIMGGTTHVRRTD